MIDPLDPKTEHKLRQFAIGQAIPVVEQDKFRRGEDVTMSPDQLMSALRSAFLFGQDTPKSK